MNHFRSRTRVLGVVALLLVASSCGGDSEVAEVADETLTQDDVVDLLADPEVEAAGVDGETLTGADIPGLIDGPPEGTIDKTAAAEAITTWVRNQLWFSELAERDAPVTDAQLAEARASLESIAETDPEVPDLTTALGDEIVRSQALPVAVAAYLIDVVKVEMVWPEQMCTSHILLETEEEAIAAIARLDAGEDFAELAAELSSDPSSANGGDLGCVDPASFVPEFVEGARLVDAPGVSAPVQSEFGWHVIDVHSFDSSPSEDPATIQNAAFSTEEFVALQEAVVARPVTIDPRYGTWDTETFAVVPADS